MVKNYNCKRQLCSCGLRLSGLIALSFEGVLVNRNILTLFSFIPLGRK